MPVKRRPAGDSYFWFEGQSVARLTEKLTTTPNPRLIARVKNGKMTFEVVNAGTGVGHDPINDSHLCPPQCP